MLATASEYFDTLFSGEQITHAIGNYEIDGVTGETLISLVNYCYAGTIEITANNVQKLSLVASKLLFTDIENECKFFLKNQLTANPQPTPQQCLIIYGIATQCAFAELAEKSAQLMCSKFSDVLKSKEFYDCSFSTLQTLLKHNEYFSTCEEEIFDGLMDWVEYDRAERVELIPEILKLIRLSDINATVNNFLLFCS